MKNDLEQETNNMITKETIILDPNPLLRQKAKKVDLPLSQEDQDLAHSLYEYVVNSTDEELAEKYNLQPAVGIAAPQIGILKQMCAIVVHDFDEEGNITNTTEFVLVNPVLLSKSQKETALLSGEGCLSIQEPHPGLVYRSHKIKVKAYDALRQETIIIDASGYLAIVIQHELDHLNGVLFYDHISKTQPNFEKPNAVLI